MSHESGDAYIEYAFIVAFCSGALLLGLPLVKDALNSKLGGIENALRTPPPIIIGD